MKLLSILAYVESEVETLASTDDGIGLLIEAVEKLSDLINENVTVDVLNGTIGAVKMLGKVAVKTAEHSAAIADSGGTSVSLKHWSS